jgi:hypothetical protein
VAVTGLEGDAATVLEAAAVTDGAVTEAILKLRRA